ncbi:MAG: flagellar hook assembly protein FlgD [Lachnospiraceae bacterium]
MAIIQQIENGKLVDSSASNTSLSTENKSDAAGGALDKDAFLQLLVAQMQYQDPLEPTDNTEYISQLATFSQLEEMQNLNQSLTEGSAYNLVGKYVFVKVTNNQTGETSYDHGMVEYVMRENGKVYISVNDSLYNIDDLDTVSDPDYYTAITVAKSFTNMVQALPSEKNLTIYDEEKIKSARTVYDSLTDYQKSFISPDTVKTLEQLEAKLKTLKGNTEDSSKGE